MMGVSVCTGYGCAVGRLVTGAAYLGGRPVPCWRYRDDDVFPRLAECLVATFDAVGDALEEDAAFCGLEIEVELEPGWNDPSGS